jgi:hypothetical protein
MNYPTIVMLTGCTALAGFIVYRYFIRGNGKAGLRDIFYLGHVFILTLLIFVGIMGSYMVLTRLPQHRAFDRRLWDAEPGRRIEMANDLLRHHLLDAKPLSAVKELLGAPVYVIDDSLGSRLGYYLGIPKGPFSVDPEFLIVDIRNGHAGHNYLQTGVPFVDWP